MMQNDQIKQMTERFLSWELPENFNPDDGISFEPVANKGTVYERRRQPTGTNLFDYTQAEAMVRYMVEGLERTAPTREGPSEDWCINMARLEGDHEIGAGALDHPLRCPPLSAPATDSTDLEARLRATAEVADEICSAANITTCDGYYEVDVDAVSLIIEKDRADTLASQRAEITQLKDELDTALYERYQFRDKLARAREVLELVVEMADGEEARLDSCGEEICPFELARQALKDTAHD